MSPTCPLTIPQTEPSSPENYLFLGFSEKTTSLKPAGHSRKQKSFGNKQAYANSMTCSQGFLTLALVVLGPDNSLMWEAVLCTMGCLTACLASTH